MPKATARVDTLTAAYPLPTILRLTNRRMARARPDSHADP